jgi:hypothetical protein
MAHIYKDYQIIGGVLFKNRISEKKHLLWKEGGVPCVSAPIWDKYYKERSEIKNIRFQTDKARVFKMNAETFDKNKKEIDFGFGQQYVCGKEHWEIVEYNNGGITG